ncbi:type II secretion system F family protein [Thermaurantiacus sp.]
MSLPPLTLSLALVAAFALALVALVAGLLLVRRQLRISRRMALVRRSTGDSGALPFSARRPEATRVLRDGAALPSGLVALVAPDPASAERLQALLATPVRAALLALGLLALTALLLHAAGVEGGLLLLLSPALSLLLAKFGLRRASVRWRESFRSQLPDAIGLMVRGIRAGVPVAEAVADVGREFPQPIGREFRAAHEQVRLGQPLESALWSVATRAQIPEMNFLCVTIAVQRETGGNLAETLSHLEQMIRKRAALQLKIRALSSEARASALIIGALPLLMAGALFVMAPDYVAPLVETGAGRLLLATAIACLGVGALVMTHIVRSQA